MVALAVAAEATTTLRVGTLVLDNDFRHPVVLAKEAATLDVVTGGRFEFGLGAGWMTTDYDAVGDPMDPPSVRVARLAESLEIMRAMWRTGSATFAGEHYRVDGRGRHSPAPVTPGGPPLVIGGGSRRILDAGRPVRRDREHRAEPGRRATSVPRSRPSRSSRSTPTGCGGPGRRRASAPDELEFQCWTATVQVVPNADEVVASLAPLFDLTPDQLRAAPRRAHRLGRARSSTRCASGGEELGFSNIVVHEAEMDALAPVIAELAGT